MSNTGSRPGLRLEVKPLKEVDLLDYEQIPIQYSSFTKIVVDADHRLRILPLPEKFLKDYDQDENARPTSWSRQFDIQNWGCIRARVKDRIIGGAVLAYRTPGLNMLEGRQDMAILWDIRVAEAERGQGVGTALFLAAEQWAREKNCKTLKIETQDVNPSACFFYQGRGCELHGLNRGVYKNYPEELQLLWYKELS